MADPRILTLSKLLNIPLAYALGLVQAVRGGIVRNGFDLVSVPDAALEHCAAWNGVAGRLAGAYRALFAPLGVDADLLTVTVNAKRKSIKVGEGDAVAAYPHFAQDDCKQLYTQWTASFGPIPYPRFRKALADLYQGDVPLVPTVDLAQAIKWAGALLKDHPREYQFMSPEYFVKGLNWWQEVMRWPADTRFDRFAEAMGRRR